MNLQFRRTYFKFVKYVFTIVLINNYFGLSKDTMFSFTGLVESVIIVAATDNVKSCSQ